MKKLLTLIIITCLTGIISCEKGEVESEFRARQKAVEMLRIYETPELEKSIEEELRDFINHKNEILPDSEY